MIRFAPICRLLPAIPRLCRDFLFALQRGSAGRFLIISAHRGSGRLAGHRRTNYTSGGAVRAKRAIARNQPFDDFGASRIPRSAVRGVKTDHVRRIVSRKTLIHLPRQGSSENAANLAAYSPSSSSCKLCSLLRGKFAANGANVLFLSDSMTLPEKEKKKTKNHPTETLWRAQQMAHFCVENENTYRRDSVSEKG